MAELQKFFPPTPPAAIASYSFTDIADGTGVVILKGFSSLDNSGTTYSLSSQSPASADILSSGTIGGATSFTLIKTLNFDLTPFNRPATIKGTIIITGSWALVTTNNDNYTAYVLFTIQKKTEGGGYDDIGSVQTEELFRSTAAEETRTLNMKASLTDTNFAIGDNLRIKAEMFAKVEAGGGSGFIKLAHDPAGRDETPFLAANSLSTVLNFYQPFLLDL